MIQVSRYRHVVIYPSLVKVAIDKERPVTNSEPDSEEVIFQAEEPTNYESDKEVKSIDIEKYNTPISSDDTLEITEFTNVFSKNITLIPPKLPLRLQSLLMFFGKIPRQTGTNAWHPTRYWANTEEVIYQVDKEAGEGEDIVHCCTRQTLLIHLYVVSIAFLV